MQTTLTPTTPSSRANTREFLSRLRDSKRWKAAGANVLLWFLFGLAVTEGLSRYSPGYPIIVGTPSLPTGIYWLDWHPGRLQRGDLITFWFKPNQPWLAARYRKNLVHTKQLVGRAGDTVVAAPGADLLICTADSRACRSVGRARTMDGLGRPMTGYVPEGSAYTLRAGELWVFAPHERSLDSRYHGPIAETDVHGRARPIWLFSIPE